MKRDQYRMFIDVCNLLAQADHEIEDETPKAAWYSIMKAHALLSALIIAHATEEGEQTDE